MNHKPAKSKNLLAIFHKDEHAVVSIEFLFNSLVIFAVLMLADMQRLVMTTENLSYSESHRRAFGQATTFFDTSVNINLNLGPFQPAPGSFGGDFITRAEAAELDLSNPEVTDDDLAELPGVLGTNNGLARGVGSAYTRWWIGPRLIGSGDMQSDYELHREAYTIRPPWCWGRYPGVFTQAVNEQSRVHDWYNTIKEPEFQEWADRLDLRGDF